MSSKEEYMAALAARDERDREAAAKVQQLNNLASQRDQRAGEQMGMIKDAHTAAKESGGHKSRTYSGNEYR